jgi:hypothetical protein
MKSMKGISTKGESVCKITKNKCHKKIICKECRIAIDYKKLCKLNVNILAKPNN